MPLPVGTTARLVCSCVIQYPVIVPATGRVKNATPQAPLSIVASDSVKSQLAALPTSARPRLVPNEPLPPL